MKCTTLLLFIVSSITIYAQDTISSYKLPTGVFQHHLKVGNDTIFRIEYASGMIESERTYSIKDSISKYKRFYENGKLMMSGKLLRMNLHDTVTYFDDLGKTAAQFLYSSGNIIDTLYVNKKIKFLMGKADYYSVVYGGMPREDGGSNVRGGNGIYMFTKFYAVKLENADQQKIYKEFQTDFNGNYFLVLSEGDFGIFPINFNIDNVTSLMGSPGPAGSGGYHSNWNISKPIHLSSKTKFMIQNIHFESVGYAP